MDNSTRRLNAALSKKDLNNNICYVEFAPKRREPRTVRQGNQAAISRFSASGIELNIFIVAFPLYEGTAIFSWPVAEKHHSRSDGSVFGRGVSMSSIDVHIQEIADNPKYVRESNPICPTAAAGSNMFNSTLHGALYVLLRVIF